MARTVSTIYDELLTAKAAQTALNGLTSTLTVAFWRTWLYVIAIVQATHEQYVDQAKADIETLILGAAPNSAEWIRQQVFRFQYSSTNTQTPRIDSNYNIGYDEVNAEYKIATRCSVKTELDRSVTIKVAKEDPPVPFSAGESTDLLGFVEASAVPGIVYSIVSLDADKVYVDAEVFYDPVYASVIAGTVEAAIESYFEFLSDEEFDGFLYVSKLQDAMQAVEGVRDVVMNEIRCRADATAFGSATVIFLMSDGTNDRLYNPEAGYMVGETTGGSEFADTITYTPQ